MNCYTTPIVDYQARAIDIGISEEALDLNLSMARENGGQEGNLNAGYHCDPLELSLLHPFWKTTDWDEGEVKPEPNLGEKRVAFGEKVSKKVGWDSSGSSEEYEEDTDFVERGDRALCKVVKIVESVIKSSGTIIPILLGVKDKNMFQEMNIILNDIVYTLEAHVVFQYFAGFPPEKLSPHILRNAAEVARNQPSGIPEVQKVDKPKLQRVAPRSIYCIHTSQ